MNKKIFKKKSDKEYWAKVFSYGIKGEQWMESLIYLMKISGEVTKSE